MCIPSDSHVALSYRVTWIMCSVQCGRADTSRHSWPPYKGGVLLTGGEPNTPGGHKDTCPTPCPPCPSPLPCTFLLALNVEFVLLYFQVSVAGVRILLTPLIYVLGRVWASGTCPAYRGVLRAYHQGNRRGTS